MNIGVDIRCLMDHQRTGVGEYTFGLLNSLFEIDKTNQYYLFYNSWTDVSKNIPVWQQENVHYVFTRWPNKLLNLFVWLKFIKLDNLVIKNCLKIKNLKFKIDIWFSPNLNFTHLSKHCKHILTIHDLSFEFFSEYFTVKQRLWHWFLNPKRQCQQAKMIITPSDNTKRDVVERYKIEDSRLCVLKPGASFNMKHVAYNKEQIRQKYQLPEKYILYLGTLEPRKNVEAIIQAYQLSVISYQLIITGSEGWKNKKLLKLIKDTPGVKYLGYIKEADKSTLYQLSSLFVFPSFYEGFGLPILEALASGVPVITSNRSALPEVLGDAGYLVNPYNVLEIAEAMKKVLFDEKLRGMLIGRGKKRAKEFEWGKTVEKFIKIINSGI